MHVGSIAGRTFDKSSAPNTGCSATVSQRRNSLSLSLSFPTPAAVVVLACYLWNCASFLVNYFRDEVNLVVGKTEVARTMAKLLNALGLLLLNKVVETSALAITGEYVGHSKKKVQDAMAEARGGVLFIDEAYAWKDSSFGHESQAELVQLMTDARYEVCDQLVLSPYHTAHSILHHVHFAFVHDTHVCRHPLLSLSPDTQRKWKR